MVFRKKVYGESKIDKCPFCDKTATTKNAQGISVCMAHRDKKIMDVKCACGEYLDAREGKWGPFFLCMNCGPISMKKALELNPNLGAKNQTESKKELTQTQKYSDDAKYPTSNTKKEIFIRSDDPNYFD